MIDLFLLPSRSLAVILLESIGDWAYRCTLDSNSSSFRHELSLDFAGHNQHT